MTGAQRVELGRMGTFRCDQKWPHAVVGNYSREADPDGQPPFNFSSQGGTALFRSDIEFLSATSFTLSNTSLADTKCDAKSVYADVYDSNGFLYEYSNTNGCGTTLSFPAEAYYDDAGVSYVDIDLYACNFFGCDQGTWSYKRTNPW
jgi:hypothetical protein